MMPSCSCFARRVKAISDKAQVIVFARPGYCAWGCFRDFLNLGRARAFFTFACGKISPAFAPPIERLIMRSAMRAVLASLFFRASRHLRSAAPSFPSTNEGRPHAAGSVGCNVGTFSNYPLELRQSPHSLRVPKHKKRHKAR